MFLGIEIGGTKLQLGLGGGDGELRSLVRLPARRDRERRPGARKVLPARRESPAEQPKRKRALKTTRSTPSSVACRKSL